MRAAHARRSFAMKKRHIASVQGLVLILFSLYLLFSLGSGFHHHADGFTHSDCPSCVFSTLPLLSATSVASAPFSPHTVFLKPSGETGLFPSVYSPTPAIRAPPA
jgi:hypothetical protein